MTNVTQIFNWDMIIPQNDEPIITLPAGLLPSGALSTPSGVFIRRENIIYYLVESQNIAIKLKKYGRIIIAEADEGLLRQTKIMHHWQEDTVPME